MRKVFYIFVVLLSLVGCSRVQRQIGKLNSSDPAKRIDAAFQLGEMREEAVPAIPALIERLGDEGYIYMQTTPPSSRTYRKLVKIQAAETLIKITGKDFGTDYEKWQAWYDKWKAWYEKKRDK